MIAQVLDGLADAVLARAPAAATSCISGGPNSGRLASAASALLRANIALRFDDAVIVLHLVVELQRAARLRLGVLGQRDGRRLVRNGIEREGEVLARSSLAPPRCRGR